jgi:hypothetical protein
MGASDDDAFVGQHVPQHPAACERVLQMRFVDPPHHCWISRRDRPGLVMGLAIECGTRDTQQVRLSRERQVMARSIIALRSAGRPCRAHRTKIILQGHRADLGVQRFDAGGRFPADTGLAGAEYPARALQRLAFQAVI